jgi:hypothetical protein
MLFLLAAGIAVVMIVSLLVKLTLGDLGFRNESEVLLRVFTNYLQTAQLALLFPFPWPGSTVTLLTAFEFTSSAGSGALSIYDGVALGCLLPEASQASVFYVKHILTGVSVPLLVVVLYLYFRIENACKRNGERWGGVRWFYQNKKYWSKYVMLAEDQYTATLLTVLYLVYPQLCESSFKLFACNRVVPSATNSYIAAAMDEPCWDTNNGSHIYVALLVGVPMLLGYVVGIPGMWLLLLWKHKSQLHLARVRYRYGQLYTPYRESRWWYEVVIVLRKVGLTGIAVFLRRMARADQGHVALLLLMVALTIHLAVQPYRRAEDAEKLQERRRKIQTMFTKAEQNRSKTRGGGAKTKPEQVTMVENPANILNVESMDRSHSETKNRMDGSLSFVGAKAQKRRRKYHREPYFLELGSLIACWSTLWVGVLFENHDSRHDDASQLSWLSVLIVLLNVACVLWMMYAFAKQFRQEKAEQVDGVINRFRLSLSFITAGRCFGPPAKLAVATQSKAMEMTKTRLASPVGSRTEDLSREGSSGSARLSMLENVNAAF